MKLRLWLEITLIILALINFMFVFNESLIVSLNGLIGFIIVSIPLIKYGILRSKGDE